jgi:hypothetical protein
MNASYQNLGLASFGCITALRAMAETAWHHDAHSYTMHESIEERMHEIM